MWIFHAIWVHVLLLGSIFVIYFRSPIITNLEPQSAIKLDPPSNRLVLIVTDGLRAESFFRNNCSDIPHILELMLQHNGQVGISHTRVPTESRPGHIALIAGLYEDPSAVTKGWKENPIDFDTVFHRSGKTFAWGANDVLHIFSRLNGTGQNLLFEAYDHNLDFSGRDKTYELDEWVFKRVHAFLRNKGEELQQEKQVIFFLHLLGLDTAGHVHKPGSRLFLENLQHTELGIWNIYKEFETVFTDGKTTYLLTSDHGMTNSGSHGAGDPYETDTPFFVWGAGIDRKGKSSTKSFQAGLNQSLPLHELEQAQLTPIMSSLLGLPPPTNNFGTLPQGFLNVSAEYEAHATHANALQLIEQFKKLLLEHQRGLFSRYLNSYKDLDLVGIAAYVSSIEMHFEEQNFQEAINASQVIMKKSIEGVNYYFNYYQNSLLLSTTATFLGWIFYLLQIIRTPSWHINERITLDKFCKKSIFQLLILNKLLLLFFILQRVPFVIALYHVVPVNVWGLTYIEKGSGYSSKKIPLRKLDILPIIICTELLVVTFFRPQAIALLFLVFTCFSMRRENIKD
ncbi:GPI ethanolamine phosphate transferase 1-like, partial [Teleopsis dalmanni]|uniref:GPI ethanolamine phosphate transferase 1-like n=1 Tax=Teleopsis dalmanni TaxID=139649 RepID=UPI0018CFEE07